MPLVKDAQNTNRSELLERIQRRLPDSITPRDIDTASRLIFDCISDTLAAGKRVELRGFGSFNLRIRKPRIARNPRTGASVSIGIRRIAHFKPGSTLRERVRNPRS